MIAPQLEPLRQQLLPLREQADLRNAWLRERLDSLLPALMARAGIDLWIVAAREYNEDPVIMTLLPEPAMSARRRAILLFSRKSDGSVERLTLDRYGYPGFYTSAWDPARESQFDCLSRLVAEINPGVIGLNMSRTFAFADGLTHSEHDQLISALGPFAERVISAESLCIGWLESRIAPELERYPSIVALGHALIAEAFSPRVIHPGATTADDVVWWFRQVMHDLGLRAWFHPTVEIQSPGQRYDAADPRRLIQPGDLLHCDVGFYYLGLATDQQQHAYVLRPGESAPPSGLLAALAAGNQLQDIHMTEMQTGRTGNEVLAAALERARAAGLRPQIYSHPLGYHGHAAGPTIGLWDQQDGVPGRGDYLLYDHTAYSIELNVRADVPEWDGQEVRIALEEDAALVEGQMHWLDGRQEAFYCLPTG